MIKLCKTNSLVSWHKMLSNTDKNSSFSTKTHDADFELVFRRRANDRVSNTVQDEHLVPY